MVLSVLSENIFERKLKFETLLSAVNGHLLVAQATMFSVRGKAFHHFSQVLPDLESFTTRCPHISSAHPADRARMRCKVTGRRPNILHLVALARAYIIIIKVNHVRLPVTQHPAHTREEHKMSFLPHRRCAPHCRGGRPQPASTASAPRDADRWT